MWIIIFVILSIEIEYRNVLSNEPILLCYTFSPLIFEKFAVSNISIEREKIKYRL